MIRNSAGKIPGRLRIVCTCRKKCGDADDKEGNKYQGAPVHKEYMIPSGKNRMFPGYFSGKELSEL
jgi:hypothetical protein